MFTEEKDKGRLPTCPGGWIGGMGGLDPYELTLGGRGFYSAGSRK